MLARLIAVAGLALALGAGRAAAEPYVDYAIQKGAWHVITLRVDPNRLDDYITSLKRTWGASEEIAKRRGLIDSYQIMAKLNPDGDGANVQLIEHIPSLALLEPDPARDAALLKEFRAALAQAGPDRDKLLGAADKYRTFVSDDFWKELTFRK
jgi:hypothetical protein